jgi:hypothetical protein
MMNEQFDHFKMITVRRFCQRRLSSAILFEEQKE